MQSNKTVLKPFRVTVITKRIEDQMDHLLQPTVLLPVSLVIIVLGTVFTRALQKTREKELQYHQDLRMREMEHEEKMKQLEIELEKAKSRSASGAAA